MDLGAHSLGSPLIKDLKDPLRVPKICTKNEQDGAVSPLLVLKNGIHLIFFPVEKEGAH